MIKIEQTKQGHSVQLRIGAGRRLNFTIASDDHAVAQARAEVMAEAARLLVDSGRLVEAPGELRLLGAASSNEAAQGHLDGIREVCADPLPTGKRRVTFADLAEEWASGRLAKKFPDQVKLKKSAKDDRRLLEHHCKTVGDVPLVAFSLDHAEEAMAALPPTASSPSTRRQYAQAIRKLLALAVYPCRIIAASPIPKGFAPKPARQPDFVCLYPSEERQLMACIDLPLEVRALYGTVCREGMRLSEALDLTWGDVDVVNGLVRLHVTKTDQPREWDLDPSVVRTLKALRALHPGLPSTACIFPQLDRTTLSKRLRADLLKAGVDRAALHTSTASSEPLRFHDLRASFITIALVNGRTEAWVTDRTGHTTSQMMYRYKRPHMAKLVPCDWLPLDDNLGLSAPAAAVEAVAGVDDGRDLAGLAGHERHTGADAGSAAQLAAQAVDETPIAGSASHLDALTQIVVGQGAADDHGAAVGLSDLEGLGRVVGLDISAHGALQNSGVFGWQHLAAGLAGNFFGASVTWEIPSVIPTVYDVGRGGLEPPAYGLKVLREDTQNPGKTQEALQSSTQEAVKAHELPRSSLSDDMLAELAELAVASKRWHLVAALGSDLDAIAQSRATQSNVTSLLVERRKRGA